MSRSSVEACPAYRAAGNLILVVVALLLAVLSGRFEPAEEQRRIDAGPAAERSRGSDEPARAPRGLFSAAPEQDQARRYHPDFETSDAAGALGFWILISLVGALLSAAAVPFLLHRIKGAN